MLTYGPRPLFIALIAICLWPRVLSASSDVLAPDNPGVDPLRLYGGVLEFDIRRNGEHVGEHVVRFLPMDGGIAVHSKASIDVKLWFVSAYSFRYEAREIWRDGMLHWLSAVSEDDGKSNKIEAALTGDRLRVQSSLESYTIPPVPPTTHWNKAQVESDLLLNTLTGNVNRVDVENLGVEVVGTENGTISAERYRYSGDLDVDVWYDRDGRWVKLHFAARDGSSIEYVCRACGTMTNVSNRK